MNTGEKCQRNHTRINGREIKASENRKNSGDEYQTNCDYLNNGTCFSKPGWFEAAKVRNNENRSSDGNN